MRLLVWPAEPAQAFGRLVADAIGAELGTVEPHRATASLADGAADLALVPTLDALRDPKPLALVPAVGLVSETSPGPRLDLSVPLDAIGTLAFDRRHAHDGILARLLLREHYGAEPELQVGPDAADATLVDPGTPAAAGSVSLDLGREWTDLTLRPMVWGLLAARADALPRDVAQTVVDVVHAEQRPDEPFAFSLQGLGYAGLEAYADLLFYAGALPAIPELPFLRLADPDDGE